MNAVSVMQNWVNALVAPIGPMGARLVLAAIAVFLFVTMVVAVRAGRIHVFRSVILIALSLLFAALAWNLQLLLEVNRITFLGRIRLLMGVLSFVVLLVTFEAVRRAHLRERYALLWMSTGIILLLCALFTDVLDFFCALFGMQYVTFVVAVIFTFLLLVAFHFSIALSRLSDDRSRLAQRCARLEARIEELEKKSRRAES
ncbi:MAG: DUF2304 domain-containing protein [Kiritimatiellae bacterium]|nr:DUF2304 domain-containing protein [Kiritimatiellia bacterium]MCO5044521.1 DUF2304 domain-containing protein [Kiritimatiellia bacterium]MCO5061568.1 DUF2304 domain-containing protein [Kiritimatiellia bacterium]MCO5067353.1 DUF2304 domain-containing protein [Kiritimatiellia bacterium]